MICVTKRNLKRALREASIRLKGPVDEWLLEIWPPNPQYKSNEESYVAVMATGSDGRVATVEVSL